MDQREVEDIVDGLIHNDEFIELVANKNRVNKIDISWPAVTFLTFLAGMTIIVNSYFTTR